MEVEVESPLQSQQNPQPNTPTEDDQRKCKSLERSLVVLNFTVLIVGACSAPLLLRLYVVKGGNRKWLSSWLQTGGWPLLLVLIIASRCYRQTTNSARNSSSNTGPYLMTPQLFLGSTVIGVIIGLNCFLYAQGNSYLPVSTTTLLSSTQLGFTAFFAFILVKQKFKAYTINAVVLLSLGAIVLGIHSDGDRPKGETKGMYCSGFIMMLGAAGTLGLALPLMELSQRKAMMAMSYTSVLEMQLVISLVANLFSTVGMAVNRDFQVLALIFFHDPFDGDKGIALGLSLWGSASYFYGEFRAKQASKQPS